MKKRPKISQTSVMALLRILPILANIFAAPILITNLGFIKFGEVMLLQGVYLFLQMIDLGIGNAITVGKIKPAFINHRGIRVQLTSNFLKCIGILFILFVFIIFLDITNLLNLRNEIGSRWNLPQLFTFYGLSFCNLILTIFVKYNFALGFHAMQQMFAITSLLAPSIAMIIASFLTFDVITLVVITQIVQFMVLLVNAAATLNKIHVVERENEGNESSFLEILKDCGSFFALQIIAFMVAQGSILIVGLFASQEQLSQYALAQKILMIHISVVSFALAPFQAKLSREKQISWFSFQQFAKSTYLFSLTSLGVVSLALVVVLNSSLMSLLFEDVLISNTLIFSLLVYGFVWSINVPFSIWITSRRPSRWYIRDGFAALILYIGLTTFLLSSYNFIEAPLIVASLTSLVFSTIPVMRSIKTEK